ncbi:S9 family peptidase [Sulfobacillus sp. hq2]|uniref:S9 family peptidase n=2 Tax=Sulfobacillus TaxID=28033 RepID=UPI000CCFE055|nr:S9 family peptidase [Sulfobacillus sp. hq2]POB11607.1 acylaminoacyl-peptidase [Sulfobacillus sp. hq2]
MDSSDLLLLKTWGQAVSDPQGRVYMVESHFDAEQNRVCHQIMRTEPLDGGATWASPVPFTTGDSDIAPQISPDGAWLGFISKRSGSRQVWVMSTTGGEPRQVTRFKGGVSEFIWHPSSRQIAVVAATFRGLIESEVELARDDGERSGHRYGATRDVMVITDQYYKHDGMGYFNHTIQRVVLVDMDRPYFVVLTAGISSASCLAFSKDGSDLYYLQRPRDTADSNPGVQDIFRCHVDTLTTERVTDLSLAITRLVVAGPSQLVITAANPNDYGYGNEELYVWDQDEQILRPLSRELDRPVGDHSVTDVAGLAWDNPVVMANATTVIMSVSSEGCVHLWAFSLEGGPPKALTQGDKVIYSFARHPHGVVVLSADDRCPSILSLVGQKSGIEPMLRVAMPWPAYQLAEPQALSVTSADGTSVAAWMLLPENIQQKVPAVLEVHGGPMAMYGHRFNFELQWLRAQGYAVIFGNPRGSLGYGQAYCRSIVGEWGDKDYADVMAIIDAAIAHPYASVIDAGRLGILGGSYGGFMVNWVISHTNRFRCAVTMRSVVNRFSAMGTSDLGWLRVPQYGDKPWWEDPAPYWQQSPLRYASQIDTPLLIEHQLNDFRLPVEQAEQLYHALKYLGKEVKMVLYPDESHGMSRQGKPWHRIFRLEQIGQWVNQHLMA